MEIVQVSAKQTPMKTGASPWKWIGIVALVLLVGAAVAARMVIVRAEPILRTRVIETLSNRFDGKVELADLHVSVVDGIEVSGGGLKIFGATDPNPYEPGVQALIGVQEFRFQTSLLNLFRSPMHVETVYVKGLELNIPPKGDRREMTKMGSKTGKMTIFVDRFACEDTRLLINTSKPGKPPLEFAIGNLRMKDIGPDQPLQFDATLVNPEASGRHSIHGSLRTLATRQSSRHAGSRGLFLYQRRPEHNQRHWRDALLHRPILGNSRQYCCPRKNRYAGLSSCEQWACGAAAHGVPRHC